MAVDRYATVVGVFHDRAAARDAVAELIRAGFREDQVGIVARQLDGTVEEAVPQPVDPGNKVGEAAATGIIAGAGIGALWALGIVTLGLPAVGPAIAGGILASVLASATGTAVAGGVLGALVGLGIPEEQARYYENEFHEGRLLVTVRSTDRAEEAAEILHRHGGYDIHNRSAATATV